MVDVTNLNLFACCRCLRHAGKIMLLVVVAIAGGIYYSVLVNAFLPGLGSDSLALAAVSGLGLVVYTAVVLLLLWSYFATFLTEPGQVPPGWHPFSDEEEATSELDAYQQLMQQQQASSGGEGGAAAAGRAYLERPRFCKKCQAWKPPRAHHDSMTGCCVLKMDHFCVWVLNCVGLLNYKHFVLFIGYAWLACTASAALLVAPCVQFFADQNPPLGHLILGFLTFVFSIAFSLALLGFLIMHLRLIALNQTTIEAYEKRPVKPWPYDRCWRRNFQEVFGKDSRLWLLPRHSPEHVRSQLDGFLNCTLMRHQGAGASSSDMGGGGLAGVPGGRSRSGLAGGGSSSSAGHDGSSNGLPGSRRAGSGAFDGISIPTDVQHMA